MLANLRNQACLKLQRCGLSFAKVGVCVYLAKVSGQYFSILCVKM